MDDFFSVVTVTDLNFRRKPDQNIELFLRFQNDVLTLEKAIQTDSHNFPTLTKCKYSQQYVFHSLLDPKT
jgi:hypothetical protein